MIPNFTFGNDSFNSFPYKDVYIRHKIWNSPSSGVTWAGISIFSVTFSPFTLVYEYGVGKPSLWWNKKPGSDQSLAFLIL